MNKCFNNISYFNFLDSSNDYLIGLHKSLPVVDPLTIYVDNQKKGRGSMGKKWASSKGGLTFSFSVKMLQDQHPFIFNMLTTIAIQNLLSDLDIQASIKYPNDILVKNKKIAGVLTDIINVQGQKYAVVGIGLNVNNLTFPQKIPDGISLFQLLLKNINKEELFKKLIFNIKDLIKIYINQKHDIKKLYFENLQGVNNYVIAFLRGKKVFLRILDITSQGVLTIQEKKSMVISKVKSTEVKFNLT